MGKIQLLDLETSNKIAAGEVVERPASVIKELVENSIDAGADKITVEIKNGGSVFMRVSDNGSGMKAEDASIAFLRHATSKIKTGADLDAIYTLGFRGEALASVGAVSHSEILTKEKNSAVGTRVTCDGGEIVAEEEAGISEGTVITVRDLFYNTPARRKFLKKDVSEAGYISDILERFILSYPEISFRFISNGKEKLFSSGDGSLKNAVYSVYGKDYAEAVIEVNYKTETAEVTGVIGKGTLCRPNRNFQSFFVNKRYIKSGILIKAAEEAYKNQIMIGKFPVLALNLAVNPESIDINVHPTKLEVKFSNERAVYEVVYYAVKNTLYALPNVPEIKRSERKTLVQNTGVQLEMNRTPEFRENTQGAEQPDIKRESKNPDFSKINHESSRSEEDPLAKFRKTKTDEMPVFKEPEIDFFAPEKPAERTDVAEVLKNAVPERNEEIPEFKIIGQIFATYIIAEAENEMLLIDQHAAHERLKYEELLKELAEKKLYPQVLLEPVIISLNGAEMSDYLKSSDILAQMGFENEEFGEKEIIVRTSPADVEWADVENLFLELLTKCAGGRHEVIADKFQRMIYTIACKSAIKAKHILTGAEMEALVKNVLSLKNINTCPHGRPIIIKMTKNELEKQFKRIV